MVDMVVFIAKVAGITALVVIGIMLEACRCHRCGGLHGGNFCFRRPPGGWDEW